MQMTPYPYRFAFVGALLLLLASLLMADELGLFLFSNGGSRTLILRGRKVSLAELKQALQPFTQVRVVNPELTIWVHPGTPIKDVVALAEDIYVVGLTNLIVEMHEQPGDSGGAGVRLRIERQMPAVTENGKDLLNSKCSAKSAVASTNAVTVKLPCLTQKAVGDLEVSDRETGK